MSRLQSLRIHDILFVKGDNPLSPSSSENNRTSEYEKALRSCVNWHEAIELWRITYRHLEDIDVVEHDQIERSGIFF